jgi:hypothetical protein
MLIIIYLAITRYPNPAIYSIKITTLHVTCSQPQLRAEQWLLSICVRPLRHSHRRRRRQVTRHMHLPQMSHFCKATTTKSRLTLPTFPEFRRLILKRTFCANCNHKDFKFYMYDVHILLRLCIHYFLVLYIRNDIRLVDQNGGGKRSYPCERYIRDVC